MQTYASVIDDLGGPAKFSEAVGISRMHAGVMKNRDSIPPAYWPRIVAAAAMAGKPITYETLAQIAARKQQVAA
jgi:hypothetical protein